MDKTNLVVVTRARMVAEAFASHLIQLLHPDVTIIITPAVTSMPEETLEKLSGRDVLIYGGYYRGNYGPILEKAKSVNCVVQEEEDQSEKSVNFIVSKPCEWTIKMLGVEFSDFQHEIAKHLDAYLYDYPNEDDLNFQNGIYGIDAPNDLEKIKKIQSMKDVADCIERGKEKRKASQYIAQERVKKSTVFMKEIDGETVAIRISEGDSHIVDSCLALAETSPSGIGVLVRRDYTLNRTYISVCCLKNSGKKAGRIANLWMNGGGSMFMGGGSREGLLFFHLE